MIREKIGQLIFTGFKDKYPSREFVDAVKEYKIGNVILFSHNIESRSQARQLCDDLQKTVIGNTGRPAFISVDQEGGMVTRLSQDCTNVPGAMAISATGNPENAFKAGEITGSELRALGINIDLAPVMDVNSNPANPVIGVRSYGDNPGDVSAFGIEMMRGLNKGGVMSVLKHFPGHGDTAVDSHLDLPMVNKSLEELEKAHLVPFIKAVQSGAQAVMTSHILFPQLEKEKVPATMSHAIITGLLKGKLDFKGLVMTDCLEMNAIKEHYGTARGALEAIKAGADMIFISHSATLAGEAVLLIEKAISSGELSMERLNDAYEKVQSFKEVYAKTDMEDTDFSIAGSSLHHDEAMRISSESIAVVRDNRKQIPVSDKDILFVGCYASHITDVMNALDRTFNFPDFMAEKFDGESLLISTVPNEEDREHVMAASKGKKTVVFGTYNGHLFKNQLNILNDLIRVHDNVIAVALRNPYDLSYIPEDVTAVAAYEYTPLSLENLTGILKGEIATKGRLCIKI